MQQKKSPNWHIADIAVGFTAMAIRLLVLFAVIGLGYLVYIQLGPKWFHVYIFAAIATRLHFELVWIERYYDENPVESDGDDRPENPFRKR